MSDSQKEQSTSTNEPKDIIQEEPQKEEFPEEIKKDNANIIEKVKKKEEKEEKEEKEVKEEKELKEEKDEKEIKEEKHEKEIKEEKDEKEIKDEREEKEVKKEKEEKVNKEEIKEEKDEKDEKDLSPEEEDKKELYDAIKDLKPEDANDNIKSKLLSLADMYLEYKKIENDKYGQEYDALQDKYDKQYQQIYDKIDDIVKSKEKIEITPEECEKYGITDDGEILEIEDYWNKVIINSRYFTITDKDKTILKYIKNVKLVKFPENVNNFRVDFIFQQNIFFTPEILSKTYEYDKDGVLKKAIGTDIQWVSKDKNPTIEKVKKKIKKGKKIFYETKEEKIDSFFSFFSQVDDMSFLTDEVTFFKEDLFINQLEYFLDIVTKTKNGGLDDEDLDDEDEDGYKDGDKGGYKGGDGENKDGKKEECKQQ